MPFPRFRFLCGLALQTLLLSGLSIPADVHAQAARVQLTTQALSRVAAAEDAGAVPGAQRLTLTVSLAPPADRQAALQALLSAQETGGSAGYHQWLTPQQFASRFGASADQTSAATAWIQGQGLAVEAVSPSGLRITISGTAAQVQTALGVSLRQYRVAGAMYFGVAGQPSLPPEVDTLFTGIEGLSNLPAASGAALTASAYEAGLSASTVAADFGSLADLIDRNTDPLVTLSSGLCASDLADSQIAAFTALFQQANAQGITLFSSRGCASGAFPANLPEVTAVAAADSPAAVADSATMSILRPGWQAAPGLPADALRHQPDLTASSVGALAQTIAGIVRKTGVRQGNINPILYALAPAAGLYTQPDTKATGTWEAATGLGLVDLQKLAQVFPQGTTSTSVQVTPSAFSLVHGNSFTVSATVATQNGAAAPTGTITFSSTQAGFPTSSVPLDPGGTATSSALQLPGGTYPITATYSGDATYASAAGTTGVTVQPEAATFSLSTTASVPLGGQITGTATLVSASGFGTPTGTITVTPNGLAGVGASTQTVSGSNGTATASFSFPASSAGTISFQATCTSGDASFTCYSQAASSTTVAQATPVVTLTASNNAPTAGTQVTYTATVSGVAGIAPTGNVQFFDGAGVIGGGAVPTASVTVTLAPGVRHSITAVYNGDGNYAKITSAPLTPAVATASTTTTASISPASVVYGSSTNLVVAITPSTTVNGTAPTGTLTLTGAGSITSAPVTGALTTVPLGSLPVGLYSITVSYSGDPNYGASATSAPATLTVAQAAGVLTSQPAVTTFTTGSTSTLTEQIQLPGNAQLPAGSTFTATVGNTGQVYTGTFNINSGGNTGTGQVILQAPIAGTYTVTVTCSAGPNIVCMPSTFVVTSTATATMPPTGSGTVPTTTTLSAGNLTPQSGIPVTLTSTVAVTTASTLTSAISGSVTFYDGATILGSSPVALVGTVETATLAVTLAGNVTHVLTAVYTGDAVYKSSASPALQVVTTATPAAISLTASATSGLAGSAVTFTATVTGSNSSGTAPTGTVAFYLGSSPGTLIATVPLTSVSSGASAATFTTSSLPAGRQTLYAVYSGDTNFGAVTSASVTVGLTDYSVSLNPSSLTVTRGQTVQTTLTLNLINGFPGPIALGCTVPAGVEMTCTFSPSVLSGGASTSTLTITTTSPSGQAEAGKFAGLGWIGALAAAGILLVLPSGRRRIPGLLLLLLAVGLTVNLGCGGNNFNAGNSLGGTPLGTTIFTVTTSGTSGSMTVKHNLFLQVTVDQ